MEQKGTPDDLVPVRFPSCRRPSTPGHPGSSFRVQPETKLGNPSAKVIYHKMIIPGGADRPSPGKQLCDVTGVHIILRNGAQLSATEDTNLNLYPTLLGPRTSRKVLL